MRISLRRQDGRINMYAIGVDDLPLLGPGEPGETVEVMLGSGRAWRGDRDERRGTHILWCLLQLTPEETKALAFDLLGLSQLTPEEAKALAFGYLGLSGDNEDILKQLRRRETALANDLLGLAGDDEDILERLGNQVTELRRAIDGLGTQLRSFDETIELLPGNRSE